MINLKLAEKGFLIALTISVVLSFLFHPFINSEYLSNSLVVFNSIAFVSLLILGTVKNNKAIFLILAFFCLRIFVLYLDYYGKGLVNILHSGGDSERFYEWGLLISNDFSRMKELTYTRYTDFLAILYWMIGDQRLFSQFLNLVLGMWSIFVFLKILDLFKLKDSKKLFFLALYGIYPQNIIFSSILLRETLIQLFFVYSILFFTRWLMLNNRVNIFKTMFFVFLSSLFHSGMLLGLLFYGFIFLFFDVKKYKMHFSFKKITMLVLFCGFLVVLISFNNSVLTGKLAILNSSGANEGLSFVERLDLRKAEAGGATYLRSFEINSLFDLVTIMPLRLVYFIFSPMPYDVRGLGDLAAILLDTSFYYFLVYRIVRSREFIRKNDFRIFPKIFISLFLIVSLGFAFGTDNSGTAMRHRSKIFPILLMVVIFTESIKQNKFSIWNEGKTN
jgi:hypothetical protein